jgi:cation transport regulator ChaB
MITSEYDLSRPLGSALKAKAPFVGIPLSGHRPLIFKRAKLQRMLKGVRVTHVEVDVTNARDRYLIVQGTAGKVAWNPVRCNYRIRSIPISDLLTSRSQKEREEFASKVAAVKVSPLQHKIAKLESERQRYIQGLRSLAPRVYREWDRAAVLAWYQGKPERRDPKYKEPVARILSGVHKPYCMMSDSYPERNLGPERYWFLTDREYLSIREELRGLSSIQEHREKVTA